MPCVWPTSGARLSLLRHPLPCRAFHGWARAPSMLSFQAWPGEPALYHPIWLQLSPWEGPPLRPRHPVTLGAASLPPVHGSWGCPSVLSLPAPGSPQGLLGGHGIHALLGPGGGRVSTHLHPSPGPYLVTHSVTQLDQPRAATASGLIWPPGRAAPSWSSTLRPEPQRAPRPLPCQTCFSRPSSKTIRAYKLDNVALSDPGSQPASGAGPWPLAEEGASPGAVRWH